MITVGIIGILATVATPIFRDFIWRSKSTELMNGLNLIYKGAAAYYATEHVSQGLTVTGASGCLPPTVRRLQPCTESGGKIAGSIKTVGDFETDPTWAALNFRLDGPTYSTFYWGNWNTLQVVGGLCPAPTATASTIAGGFREDGPALAMTYLVRAGVINDKFVRQPGISFIKYDPWTSTTCTVW